MAKQKQDDQFEHTYSSYVRIRDVALKTCHRRWMIGKSGERGSGISVLATRHDDGDDDLGCHCYRRRSRGTITITTTTLLRSPEWNLIRRSTFDIIPWTPFVRDILTVGGRGTKELKRKKNWHQWKRPWVGILEFIFASFYFFFGLVWFLCLMAYQPLKGYLMPKLFSLKNSSSTI